jgi:hypothetical protein
MDHRKSWSRGEAVDFCLRAFWVQFQMGQEVSSLKVYFRAVNKIIYYKTDIKIFNIRLIYITSHYMFRSAEIIIRWFTITFCRH